MAPFWCFGTVALSLESVTGRAFFRECPPARGNRVSGWWNGIVHRFGPSLGASLDGGCFRRLRRSRQPDKEQHETGRRTDKKLSSHWVAPDSIAAPERRDILPPT